MYNPKDMLRVMQESLGQNDNETLSDALSFEDVYGRFLARLEQEGRTYASEAERAWRGGPPCPLLSILVDDCIERGVPITIGAPSIPCFLLLPADWPMWRTVFRYSMNWSMSRRS
jgi:hypothetical protein